MADSVNYLSNISSPFSCKRIKCIVTSGKLDFFLPTQCQVWSCDSVLATEMKVTVPYGKVPQKGGVNSSFIVPSCNLDHNITLRSLKIGGVQPTVKFWRCHTRPGLPTLGIPFCKRVNLCAQSTRLGSLLLAAKLNYSLICTAVQCLLLLQ